MERDHEYIIDLVQHLIDLWSMEHYETKGTHLDASGNPIIHEYAGEEDEDILVPNCPVCTAMKMYH